MNELDGLQLRMDIPDVAPPFPSTRYQGSKLKLVNWIWDCIKHLPFDTALDAFGGTGCVSHMLKSHGVQVTYNDLLRFNHLIGVALIENNGTRLSSEDIDWLLTGHETIGYPTFIADTFKDIYYTDEENRWLDRVSTNIRHLNNHYKQALAYFALFQACIIKRPYNLFHRKNLYLRTAQVERTFGNKTTWDKSFEVWFRQFVAEANAAVFGNGRSNRALNQDVLEIDPGPYDLVYIDPPYVSANGTGVDYLDFYHFLEGLVDYENWPRRIDYRTKHRKLRHNKSVWANKNRIRDAFDRLFAHFSDCILVVSYRENGIPSPEELHKLLQRHKGQIDELHGHDYQYVLSNGATRELLLIAQ